MSTICMQLINIWCCGQFLGQLQSKSKQNNKTTHRFTLDYICYINLTRAWVILLFLFSFITPQCIKTHIISFFSKCVPFINRVSCLFALVIITASWHTYKWYECVCKSKKIFFWLTERATSIKWHKKKNPSHMGVLQAKHIFKWRKTQYVPTQLQCNEYDGIWMWLPL